MEKRDWLNALIAHEMGYAQMIADIAMVPFATLLSSDEMPGYHDANRALALRDDGRGPESVARSIVSYFRSRGTMAVADLDPVAEAAGIGRALRRLGITPVIGEMLLLHFVGRMRFETGSSVRVERVPNGAGTGEVREWVDAAACDERDSDHAAMWRTALEHEAKYAPCALFLGKVGNSPAGACSLYSSAGWGRIDSVATCPQFRRRGVASAIVQAALLESAALGNVETYLYVEAGSDAERLYRALGFAAWNRNPFVRHIEG